MEFERFTHNETETMALGEALGRTLRAGDVMALVGELGAGKTRFVRGVAQGLGVDPRQVNSPTYVIVNEYERADSASDAPPLVHIDAYRLSSDDDLRLLGLDDFTNSDAVMVIEWADRIAGAIPAGALWISIEHARAPAPEPDNVTARRLTFHGDAWAERLASLC